MDDLSIISYIIQMWMIYVCCYLYRTEKWMNHPNLDDLYDPILDESEHLSKSSEIGCFYNPLLDDSEHAC